ncbi:hypothetical protein ACFLQT_00520 [Bacteroidota bacterium]
MKKIQPFFFLFLFSILSTNYHAQVGNELPADNDIDILMILPTGYGPNYFFTERHFRIFRLECNYRRYWKQRNNLQPVHSSIQW